MSLLASEPLALNPWHVHPVVLRDRRTEFEGISTSLIDFIDRQAADNYEFKPGQFNMLYIPGAGEVAISVAGRDRESGSLEHTIRVAGNVTRELSRFSIGDTFGLRGPFGNPWPMEDCRGRNVILVAGGIGLAPLRPVIHEFVNNRALYGKLTLLYGARTPDSLLYEVEYEQWRQKGLMIQTTVDRASEHWMGNIGVVPLLLDRLRLADAQDSVLMACGPEVMMSYTVISAQRRGILPEHMWLSLERNMNCAIGLCGHCQLGPTFVCKNGPVLRFDEIARFWNVRAL
jgi:NAD(P)H-flavin reductase